MMSEIGNSTIQTMCVAGACVDKEVSPSAEVVPSVKDLSGPLHAEEVPHALPAELGDAIEVRGDELRPAQGQDLRVPLLLPGEPVDAALVDPHLEVVRVPAAVEDPLRDRVRAGRREGLQVGDLQSHLGDEKLQVVANALGDPRVSRCCRGRRRRHTRR